jgi:hypothetical protein
MNFNNIQEYIDYVVSTKEEYIRLGQHYFNILHECKPDLADEIRGSSIDPFYLDENIESFLLYIGKKFDS